MEPPTVESLKRFADALYLQGVLTAALGLPPDSTAKDVERAVLERLALRRRRDGETGRRGDEIGAEGRA